MDMSLPSYEAAMRDAREYLRRRDLSSQDEVPLYFAWERLYAAANANLSTDFLLETNVERRARQQARLAPRRGLPPPLFTSFDKVNRRSAQASAFLRSGPSSDVAIEMMARRYRREAEKQRSSRHELVMGSLDGAGKRMKKGKRRQKSPEQEVEELLEAFEHSKVLPEDKLCASLTGKSKFETNSKSNELEVDVVAAKATELRKSNFSQPKSEAPPSFSNVANVAAFAAKVSDWKMPSDIDASSPTSKLLKKKRASTRAKSVSEANEIRRSAPTDDAEGDMTFDTSLDSSGFDEDSVDSETLREVAASSASQTSMRLTKRVGAVDAKAEVNQERKPTKTSLNGKRAEDFSRAATDTDKNLPVDHEIPARDLATSSQFQQKLAQLSHAVGDMQVKIQGKQIEVTFKGSLDETNTADEQTGEALKSEIDFDSAYTSVARKVFETRNDEENGDEELEDGAQQWAQMESFAKSTANLPRKQSSVRFADVESVDGSDDHNENDRSNDNEANEQEDELHHRQNTSDAQEDNPRQNRSSTHSSARYSTITRSTAETEPVSDEDFSDDSKEEEETRTPRSSIHRQGKSDQDQELDDQHETRDAEDFQDNHHARTNEDEVVRDECKKIHHSSSGRHLPNKIQREQSVHTAKAGSAPAKRRETQESLENVGSSLSALDATGLDQKARFSHGSSTMDGNEASTSEGQDLRRSSSRSRHSNDYPRNEPVRSSRNDSVAAIAERSDNSSQSLHGRAESLQRVLAQDVPHRQRPEAVASRQDDGEVFKDQLTQQQRDPRHEKHRDSTNGVRHRTRREADAPRSRKDRDHSTHDDENGVDAAMDGEFASSDENRSSRKRNSDRSRQNLDNKHTDLRRTPNAKRATSSSARERQSSYREKHDRNRVSNDEPQRSRKQLEELIDDELYSDEDVSDGPDTLYRRPQVQQHRHDSNRKQSWISDGSRESSTRKSSKHLPSRSISWQERSHSKRRSHSLESSADSEVLDSSDSDSQEEVGSDERYRKDQRTRVNYSRNHEEPSRSSRKSTHKPSSRDHHFIPAMEYPPKIITPEIRLKRLSKTKSELREKEVVRKLRKLSEGVVWPPGMEEECIARLGLDGHHPIAPPGLEHRVTEEQWGDYWTWLHWYSSWQMWYMKNGKKPKSNSNKEKRRHADPFVFQDGEDEHHDKHSRGNANWWVDVGPDKYHHRRSRVD